MSWSHLSWRGFLKYMFALGLLYKHFQELKALKEGYFKLNLADIAIFRQFFFFFIRKCCVTKILGCWYEWFFSVYCVAGQRPTFLCNYFCHTSYYCSINSYSTYQCNILYVLVSCSWPEWSAEWTRLCTDSQISGYKPVGDAGL